MTLTRRALLRGTAAATLGLTGLGAAGCGGLTPGRDTSGSLDYWNLFGGGDGVRMTQMLDGFRAANPGIALSAVTLAWATRTTRSWRWPPSATSHPTWRSRT